MLASYPEKYQAWLISPAAGPHHSLAAPLLCAGDTARTLAPFEGFCSPNNWASWDTMRGFSVWGRSPTWSQGSSWLLTHGLERLGDGTATANPALVPGPSWGRVGGSLAQAGPTAQQPCTEAPGPTHFQTHKFVGRKSKAIETWGGEGLERAEEPAGWLRDVGLPWWSAQVTHHTLHHPLNALAHALAC